MYCSNRFVLNHVMLAGLSLLENSYFRVTCICSRDVLRYAWVLSATTLCSFVFRSPEYTNSNCKDHEQDSNLHEIGDENDPCCTITAHTLQEHLH